MQIIMEKKYRYIIIACNCFVLTIECIDYELGILSEYLPIGIYIFMNFSLILLGSFIDLNIIIIY